MNTEDFLAALATELEWPGPLTQATELKGHEKWDSAAILATMMLIEDEAGVTLRARDLDSVVTVADLLRLIEQQPKDQ